MKTIMHRKLYDTDTATPIAEFDNGAAHNDLNWTEETLYRTSNGSWFLHGRGGPSTRWATRSANGTRGSGEHLESLLTDDDALDWCEDRDIDPALVKKYFDVPPA